MAQHTMAQENATPDLAAEELQQLVTRFLETGGNFQTVSGLSDESMEAVYSVAFNLYNGGRYEEAAKVFRFLTFFNHLERKYWMGLGGCRQMLKQFDSAIACYGFASLLDVTDPRPPLHTADCYIALGDRDKAHAALTAVLEFSRGREDEFQDERNRAQAMFGLLDSGEPSTGRN